ncbi:MAG: HEPN domain-containing protein [Firmicutes bacterium]|nr:HEPN domain-containing protein [Bacillota bacterium]
MSEIEALMHRAKESLAAARGTLRDGFPDFAASRAYYAMFYVASALLVSRGQSYNSHAAVISAFGREYAKTARIDPKFHGWLIAGQNFRNVGDYGVEAHVSKEQAALTCAWADEFIEAAGSFLDKERKSL